MSCTSCPKQATIHPSYTKNVYCEKHFYQLLLKRIRKDVRKQQPLDLNTPYYVDSSSPRTPFLTKILKAIYTEKLALTNNPQDHPIQALLLEEDVSRRFLAFLQTQPLATQSFLPLRCVSVEDYNSLSNHQLDQDRLLHPLLYSLIKHRPGAVFATHHSLLTYNSAGEEEKK